jgi:methylmalonyl-CoA/ethylmalonyl-CoA epimerase
MQPGISGLAQIALGVSNADVAEDFYGRKLGLKKLYRFDSLVFFDLGGVRLMLGDEGSDNARPGSSCLYLKVADIDQTVTACEARGVSFATPAHLIATMPDHELWMAFFTDPFGHQLALMCEKPLPST